MKKITLLVAFIALFFGVNQIQSQVINEPANWPNSDWEITGVYTNAGFLNSPTDNYPGGAPIVGSHFTFDDDAAGSGSLFDHIEAVSPEIDLTPATVVSPAEEEIILIGEYVFPDLEDDLLIQWWDNDAHLWLEWSEFVGNSSNFDYRDCEGLTSYVSEPLNITAFTPSQLQHFKYRIRYKDWGFKLGFCLNSPTLQSRETPECFAVTDIEVNEADILFDQAIVSWVDNNAVTPQDGWEIEYGTTSFVQGTGTVVNTYNNPYTITTLEASTCYDVYVRALCDSDAGVASDWFGPYNFCTTIALAGCGDVFYDIGGPDGNYVNASDETTTICPDDTGDVVTALFDAFETESCCDWLKIYDGDSSASPQIMGPGDEGKFNGTNSPGTIFASIDNGGCLTFVFHSDNSVTRLGWEARILCSPPITCFMPENLSVDQSTVTLSEATILWSDTNDTAPVNGWDVEYGPVGFELGTGTVIHSTEETLGLTDLDSGTEYCFYVKANCDDTDDSFWQGPECFTTKIGCGDIFYDNGGPDSSYENGSDETTTICPTETDEVITVVFDMFSTESGYDNLKIYDGDSVASPLLGTFEGTDSPGTISATLANGGCLTFVFHSDGSVNRPGWEARIFCSPPITCFMPEDLSATPGIHEAEISWTDTNGGAPDNGWDIQYGLAGFALGDGTIINTTDNPFILTELDANTEYCFYVKANCDTDQESFWQGQECFTTLCEAFIAPFVENFENMGATPSCWTQDENDNGDWSFNNDVVIPGHVGAAGNIFGTTTESGGYFTYVNDGFTDGNSYRLSTPMIDVSTLTDPTLYFHYVSHNEGFTNVNFSIDVWDGAAWNNDFFTSNTNTNGWSQMMLDLTTLTITDTIQVRFVITDNNGTFRDDFAIDDVVIDEAPSCWPVFDVEMSNITETSVDLNWVDNNNDVPAGGWDVEVTYPTFPQGSGTVTTVYTNSTTLNDLLPSSTYEIYIRTNCAADGSNSTIWTGPFVVNTLVGPPLNDTCDTAMELQVTTDCVPTLGNNILATPSDPVLATNCSDPAIDGVTSPFVVDDVWYKFTMPTTGTVLISTAFAGVMEDSAIAVYKGTCDNLEFAQSYLPNGNVNYALASCSDDDDFDPNEASDNNRFSMITLQNQTPGDVFYIRVWSVDRTNFEDGENLHGQFTICIVGQPSTNRAALEVNEESIDESNTNLTYYPNPVTNTLNLESLSVIKAVSIYNVLGQEVIKRTMINSSLEATIDMSLLQSGTYFGKVLLDGDKIKTIQIIKN